MNWARDARGYARRDRFAVWLANQALRLASKRYRAMIRGSIIYGLKAAAGEVPPEPPAEGQGVKQGRDPDIRGILAREAAEAEAVADAQERLDPAEMAVYEALRRLDCTVAVDSSDPEDCASVASEAVRALRAAGFPL